MKLKFRIISSLTLLALLWGIFFSGIFLFQQNQKVNSKKVNQVFSKNANNLVHDNFVLLKFLSEKTEEKNEQLAFQQDLNKKDFHRICLASSPFKICIIEEFAFYFETLCSFNSKLCLFIQYCSLKLPF